MERYHGPFSVSQLLLHKLVYKGERLPVFSDDLAFPHPRLNLNGVIIWSWHKIILYTLTQRNLVSTEIILQSNNNRLEHNALGCISKAPQFLDMTCTPELFPFPRAAISKTSNCFCVIFNPPGFLCSYPKYLLWRLASTGSVLDREPWSFPEKKVTCVP